MLFWSRLSLQKNISLEQWLIQKIEKALDAYPLDNIGKGQYYNCTTTISTTLFCVCNSTRTTYVTTLEIPLYMDWIWNCSFLGQQPNHATNHWRFDQASKRLFLMCWQATTTISHLYIKEWIPEVSQDSNNNLQVLNSAEIVLHIKVHLEFLNNFYILEILES